MQILHSVGARSLAVAAADRRMYRARCRSTQTVHSGTSRGAVGPNQVVPQGMIAPIVLQLSREGTW